MKHIFNEKGVCGCGLSKVAVDHFSKERRIYGHYKVLDSYSRVFKHTGIVIKADKTWLECDGIIPDNPIA